MKIRFAALVLALVAGSAFAAPPTDDQVKAFIDSVKAAGKDIKEPPARMAAESKAIKEGAKDLALGEATSAQIEMLSKNNLLERSNDLKTAIAPSLTELAKAQTAEGATAAMWRATLAPMPQV